MEYNSLKYEKHQLNSAEHNNAAVPVVSSWKFRSGLILCNSVCTSSTLFHIWTFYNQFLIVIRGKRFWCVSLLTELGWAWRIVAIDGQNETVNRMRKKKLYRLVMNATKKTKSIASIHNVFQIVATPHFVLLWANSWNRFNKLKL